MQARECGALKQHIQTINDNTIDHQAVGASIINMVFAKAAVAA